MLNSKDYDVVVKFTKRCDVRSYRVSLEDQYYHIKRQLTHPDLPPLYVTCRPADINFKNPNQVMTIRPEDIHGVVTDVHLDHGGLTCDVSFELRSELAEIYRNKEVYLSSLYTMIDGRVINLIRTYANIEAQYEGVK